MNNRLALVLSVQPRMNSYEYKTVFEIKSVTVHRTTLPTYILNPSNAALTLTPE